MQNSGKYLPPDIIKEMSEMSDLQSQLYDLTEENYSDFLSYLYSTSFLSTPDYVRKLILCIYSAFRFNFKHTSILCQLLIEIKDVLKSNLSAEEITMNIRNNAARVALFEHGIIDIQSIRKDSQFNFFCFRYFHSEIQNYDPVFYNNMIQKNDHLEQTMKLIASDITTHNQLRREGQSEHLICKLIKEDDLEGFQQLVTSQNYDLKRHIPYSVYETIDFVNIHTNMPTLIEYAAFHGSVNVFKYILMALQSKQIMLPVSLPVYAAAGGNYDIIHLVEGCINSQDNNPDDELDDDDDFSFYQYLRMKRTLRFTSPQVIDACIEFHRNDVLDYLVDNYPEIQKRLRETQTLTTAISFLNFRIMLMFLDRIVPVVHEEEEGNKNEMVQEITKLLIIDEENDKPKSERQQSDNEDDWTFDINQSEMNNISPLIQAVFESRIDVVRFILSARGINVNQSFNLLTPLMYAATYGFYDGILLLIKMKGSEIDYSLTNRLHLTPLHLACQYGWLDIVKFFCSLTKKTILDMSNSSVDGSLHEFNDDDYVFDVNQMDVYSFTPLSKACQHNQIDIVKFLVSLDRIKMIQANMKDLISISEESKAKNVEKFLKNCDKYKMQKEQYQKDTGIDPESYRNIQVNYEFLNFDAFMLQNYGMFNFDDYEEEEDEMD